MSFQEPLPLIDLPHSPSSFISCSLFSWPPMMDSPERDPVLLFKDSLYVIRPLIHQVFWIDQSCSRYGVATGIKNWYASVLFGAQLCKDVKIRLFFFKCVLSMLSALQTMTQVREKLRRLVGI